MTELHQKKRDPLWVYAVVGALLIGLYLVFNFELGGGTRPKGSVEEIADLSQRTDLNVLFILVDTLRADRMGSYGYDRPTTPNLDELASSGIRFDRQISQSSWTKTSMASIWTGMYPSRHGIHNHSHGVSEEARMPAEIFSDHGFVTAGIWRNGWVAPTFGFEQGFDIYIRPNPTRSPLDDPGSHPSHRVLEGTDDDLMFAAVEFLRAHRNDRWFLYLHFMDLHQYVSDDASALFGTSYSDTYDNSIRREDRLIGELEGVLESAGLLERTLIVLTSDHGEAFREHGKEGHAKDLYGEVIHVPLIIGLPFELEDGIVVRESTANVDIWPTLYELLGMEGPSGVDGKSLVDAIHRAGGSAPPASSERPIFSELDRTWGRVGLDPDPLVVLTQGDWRFMHDFGQPEKNELYDLRSDPGEQKNRLSENGEDARSWQEITRQHREESELFWESPVPEVELDEMELNHLRALGYDIH